MLRRSTAPRSCLNVSLLYLSLLQRLPQSLLPHYLRLLAYIVRRRSHGRDWKRKKEKRNLHQAYLQIVTMADPPHTRTWRPRISSTWLWSKPLPTWLISLRTCSYPSTKMAAAMLLKLWVVHHHPRSIWDTLTTWIWMNCCWLISPLTI